MLRAILGAELRNPRHVLQTRAGVWLEVRSGKSIALRHGSHTVVFQRANPPSEALENLNMGRADNFLEGRLVAVGQLRVGLCGLQ